MKDLRWLTKEFLEKRYSYDPSTGVLTSRLTKKPIQTKRGRESNYYCVNLRREGIRHSLAAHTIIFIIMTGKHPETTLDHINGNGLDNRWCNLRSASHSQQALNRNIRRDNSSGYRGVSLEKSTGLYRAYVDHNGVRKNLGKFKSKHDAARAYNEYATTVFDLKFIRLNEIKED